MEHVRRDPHTAPNAKGIRSFPGRTDSPEFMGFTLHETRSGHPDGDDGPGAEAWASNPSNGEGKAWCSMWDVLIYEDGTQVIMLDVENEYASWTAGWGGKGEGTWPLGKFSIQIEVAHGTGIEPYQAVQVDSLAQLVAEYSFKYHRPLTRIDFVTQREDPKPRGISTHAASANGVKLGKSDPGESFPWETFLELAVRYRAEYLSGINPCIAEDCLCYENELLVGVLNDAVQKRFELGSMASLVGSQASKLVARSHLMDWVSDKCDSDGVPASLAAGGQDFEYAVVLRAWDWCVSQGWITPRS